MKLEFFDDPTQQTVAVDIDDILYLQQHGGIGTIVHLINGKFFLAIRPPFNTLRHLYKTMKQKDSCTMKFKHLIQLLSDQNGFFPTTRLQWGIQKNTRQTAREEAIAAKIIEEANPRENISGHYPWNKEESLVLQQLWIHPKQKSAEWRDVPTKDAEKLFSMTSTEFGDIPIPNAVNQPEQIKGDFQQRLKEILGDDS